jgi:DNA polymerase-1
LENQIHTLAGQPFNVNSTQQLADILFNTLGIRKTKRIKTGYSTDADSLEKIRGEHEIIEYILQYRELAKLKSTYVDALPPLVHPVDGRIHTSYNQAVAATGRLSSSNPNLQNIPIRTARGQLIRRAFVAAEGCRLIAADYSQMEFRILAHMAQDAAMIDAFVAGTDFHTATAARIFGVPPEVVTKDQRRIAKTVNFGIIYGQSRYGLAKELGISNDEAEQFIQNFFQNYGDTATFLEKVKLEARTKGYVSTLLGRIRQVPEINSSSYVQQQQAERVAINMPVQGTAADVVKIAMIDIHRALRQAGSAAKMILQVHDEIVLEVPEAEVKTVGELVRTKMEQAYEMLVPLKVDVEVGVNWEEMRALAED